jgi:hypothetical protein
MAAVIIKLQNPKTVNNCHKNATVVATHIHKYYHVSHEIPQQQQMMIKQPINIAYYILYGYEKVCAVEFSSR